MAKQSFSVGQVLTAAQMQSLQDTALGGGAASSKTANYVLVAADESSMSGKAKKAKDWGIPVISVEKFITFCTFG